MPDQLDPQTALLGPPETIIVPAGTAPAVIRDCFTKNTGLRISTVFAEFKNRFFDKTENPKAEVTYRKYKLLRISADGPIIAELGGETKVEGTFAAAFALLQLQHFLYPGQKGRAVRGSHWLGQRWLGNGCHFGAGPLGLERQTRNILSPQRP